MITTILLIIIYLAFISLGLPDSILGVTIPSLIDKMGISLSAGGVISMVVVGGSVISSFFSGYIIKKIDTGKIVFISCLTTGLALFGFSIAPSYFWLILLALPLGLGGGTVDAALNNYIALHYKAHHMNWLHGFWGVGATLGPLIMSWNLSNGGSWRFGYKTISFLQLSLALFLLLSISIWRRHKVLHAPVSQEVHSSAYSGNIFKMKGLKYALITVLICCAVELGAGLWGSSYLVSIRGFSLDSAARFVSLYYAGITLGRFVSGFISFKLNNRQLIFYGTIISLVGVLLLLLNLPNQITGAALVLIGIGLAPIFPSMLHETPKRFGKKLSQKIIGYQMAFAYMGSAIVPVLLGIMFDFINISLLPIALFILLGFMLFSTSKLNRVTGESYED
ncbi:MAG: MFS transporter [Spirochaetaceae bacterium]